MRKEGEELARFDKDYLGGRAFVMGIDEAGRGALAGPVVAAAMLVSAEFYASSKYLELIETLDDSKKLSAETREALYEAFIKLRQIGAVDFEAGFASVTEIEDCNILVATSIAMKRAAAAVNARRSLSLSAAGVPATLFGEGGADLSRASVIIDGRPVKKFPFRHTAIVKGDSKSLAIAGASVIAKVTRDRHMDSLSLKYPLYAFEKHKGYGTALHSQNLMLYGPSAIHRLSFLKNLRAEPIKSRQAELF